MAAREGRGSKARRRVARTLVATYHEAELAGLVEHVAEAIERYGAGELDVHDVDEVIHRYHKATQELWKFCFRGGSGAYVETVAATLEHLTAEGERPDGGRRRSVGAVARQGSLSIKVELLSGRDLILDHLVGRVMIRLSRAHACRGKTIYLTSRAQIS